MSFYLIRFVWLFTKISVWREGGKRHRGILCLRNVIKQRKRARVTLEKNFSTLMLWLNLFKGNNAHSKMGQRVQHSAILTSTMQGYLISMSFVMLVSTDVTVIYSRSFLMKMLTILHNYTIVLLFLSFWSIVRS